MTNNMLRTLAPGVVSVDASAADAADQPSWAPPPPGEERIGICCSGGGIRSASYSLGALQALQEAGVLGEAEYLASVSGGGYISGALTMVAATEPSDLVWGDGRPPPFARMSPEEKYLRDHSKYLMPDLNGKVRMIGRLLLGLMVNIAFVGALVVLLGRAVGWLAGEVHPTWLRVGSSAADWNLAPGFVGIAGLAGIGLAALLATAMFRPSLAVQTGLTRWGRRFLGAALLLLTLWVALPAAIVGVRDLAAWLAWGLDWLYRHVTPVAGSTTSPDGAGAQVVAQVSAVLVALGIPTLLAGAVRAVLRAEGSRLAALAGGAVAPALIGYCFLAAASDAASRPWDSSQSVWVGIAAGVVLLFWTFGDLTAGSMHPFYKRRLSTAFALRRRWRRDDGTLVDEPEARGTLAADERPYDALVPLSKTVPTHGWPKLVCCAAANVSDPGITAPGRNAVTFTFDAEWIGGPEVGYVRTTHFEEALGEARAEDITLPAAMAVSGAALSPSMGRMTKPSLRLLLTLVNARLGVWLPHPQRVKERHETNTQRLAEGKQPKRWLSRPRFTYLWREMTGRNTTRAPFLYVSDGGHWENLGIVELLRRRCTTIYCVDASGDDEHSFNTIGQAIALARSELGVEIELDPSALGALDSEDPSYCAADFAIGRIIWPNDPWWPDVEGTLVFIKATVTKDAPWDVRAYKLRNPNFPNDSTLQQLYGDERFESYRALGHSSAARAHAAFVAREAYVPVQTTV